MRIGFQKVKFKQFANSKAGLRALIRWIQRAEVPLIVFEATGVYHRLLETALATQGIPFARVNPRQARRFADRTAAGARLQTATHPLLKKQFALRLRQVERDIIQINSTIDASVAADKDLAARAEILTSILGIAKVTACAILTDMPELGHLSGKQAAKLAGLAPISRQSGKWQDKGRIQGSRASLRRPTYLPAVVATRFNPDMKAKYEQLISAGKCKKLAITAVMRKLIVMANVLLRDQRKWDVYPT